MQSGISEFRFQISPPWSRTALAYLLYVVLLFALIFGAVYGYSRKLRRDNIKLEAIITQRTAEIVQQKEEIQAQAEELESINSELEKLSIVASETDNAVMIVDKDGNFEWVNQAFTRIYGMNLEQFKLKHGNNIQETSVNPNINQLITYCIENKKSVSYESYFKPENQEEIWLQTSLTPIVFPDGTLKKIIAVETEITEIKKAEEEIISQKEELQYKNSQINSSINYAKTIQTAMLPAEEDLSEYFENFIIYRPKDIVSGDFYQSFSYLNQDGQRILYIAVVDCTGHGVPGAFMSMIGMRLLSEMIRERKIENPAEILSLMNQAVVSSLKQNHSTNSDGMDAALCRIKTLAENRFEIVFAGAKSPLWIYRKQSHEIIMIKGTRKSIGGMSGQRYDDVYTDNILEITQGDSLYIFSDGFRDQNNAERERFSSDRLKQILLETANLGLNTQKQKLENALDEWQGTEYQRDDITFIGIRF